MVKRLSIAGAFVACMYGASALALEEDQVRGEIVDVQPEQNTIELRVEEAGSDRFARAGQTETYRLDEGTEIKLEDSRETLLGPTTMTIDDLERGALVNLDFEEIGGERVARNVSVGDSQSSQSGSATADSGTDSGTRTTDTAALETERTSLPDTASMLPGLAFLGAGFAGIALLLRLRRSR